MNFCMTLMCRLLWGICLHLDCLPVQASECLSMPALDCLPVLLRSMTYVAKSFRNLRINPYHLVYLFQVIYFILIGLKNITHSAGTFIATLSYKKMSIWTNYIRFLFAVCFFGKRSASYIFRKPISRSGWLSDHSAYWRFIHAVPFKNFR